ncbi:MAG TPA: hypothetical protein VF992_06070 [Thermoplasmata archaeon]
MASLDELLALLFRSLGPAGSLAALFLIFAIDAAVFPALPEVFVVIVYSYRPEALDPLAWSAALLVVAVAGEVVGNSALYWVVRRAVVERGHMPRWIEAGMRRWIGFLIVPDERMILVNRVAPVVPFVGAFIATLHWNYPKSLAFIVLGGGAKYGLLLLLIGYVGVVYNPALARWLTFLLVIAIVAISASVSFVVRRRRRGSARPPAR